MQENIWAQRSIYHFLSKLTIGIEWKGLTANFVCREFSWSRNFEYLTPPKLHDPLPREATFVRSRDGLEESGPVEKGPKVFILHTTLYFLSNRRSITAMADVSISGTWASGHEWPDRPICLLLWSGRSEHIISASLVGRFLTLIWKGSSMSNSNGETCLHELIELETGWVDPSECQVTAKVHGCFTALTARRYQYLTFPLPSSSKVNLTPVRNPYGRNKPWDLCQVVCHL